MLTIEKVNKTLAFSKCLAIREMIVLLCHFTKCNVGKVSGLDRYKTQQQHYTCNFIIILYPLVHLQVLQLLSLHS